MIKADKMFEELGYQKREGDCTIRYENSYENYGNVVEFNKRFKNYMMYDAPDFRKYVYMELHLAIHEKLKEMGWIE